MNINDELKYDFLVYAAEVNNERAFPDARDGLKPSQRAILWEMYDKKYTSNKPHVKSAKVDGGVIANWHPHGSEYGTLVRMSQPWVNNICEIDFHGANGSLLGGPEAAASRYTECRLSAASENGFFTAINKNQVDFIKNYSEDLLWPSILPAIFPRLFANGSQGIGYTIAQEWEPGNIREFAEKVKQYISSGEVTCDNIYPDYPTGGIIINKSDLHTIYETGKGSIVLRGKTSIDGDYIKITELPYQVYAEPFIQKIKDLVNDEAISGIEDICNKSDDNGMLIEIECSSDPEAVLNKLYKLTDLQVTYSANQMALVNGVPEMLNLKDYIKVYIDHNIECIKREYKFDLDKALARKEIVDGLIRAISIIDEVIAAIKASKSSDAAKESLMNKFDFTEPQAKAIVDMRLGRLANLEIVELNNELKELCATIENCNKLLSSAKAQNKELLTRLIGFVDKYGWERRTEVTDISIKVEVKPKEQKPEEEYFIALTEDNCLKRISLANFRAKGKSNCTKVIKAKASDRISIITADGFIYKMVAKKIQPGTMISSGTPFESQIISIYNEPTGDALALITANGSIKLLDPNDLENIHKKAGTKIITLENDSVVYAGFGNKELDYNSTTIDLTKYIIKGRGAKPTKCRELRKLSLLFT